jgi:hypothetical protein
MSTHDVTVTTSSPEESRIPVFEFILSTLRLEEGESW